MKQHCNNNNNNNNNNKIVNKIALKSSAVYTREFQRGKIALNCVAKIAFQHKSTREAPLEVIGIRDIQEKVVGIRDIQEKVIGIRDIAKRYIQRELSSQDLLNFQ